MTAPLPAAAPPLGCGCALPTPSTPVLLHRPLLPGTDADTVSVFDDDVWDLTPGVFESHTRSLCLNFASRPAGLREATKHYFWQLINHRAPTPLRRANTNRLSLQSISSALRRLTAFLTWLDVCGIGSFDQVTPAHLDRFLDDVLRSERSHTMKEDILTEVRRLWCHRQLLPPPMRLPAPPLWDGEDLRDLLGAPRPLRENATPRIHPDTMQPLLMWCLRFVEEFATDIIAAFAEYQRLMTRGHGSRHRLPADQRSSPGTSGWLTPVLQEWLTERRKQGMMLPGRQLSDGSREVDWHHLARVFDTGATSFGPGKRARDLVLASGLPIARGACLDIPITGQIHDRPWLDEPISYADAPRLARLLSAASAVVCGYLSGMRPGEMLTLERGCVDYDPTTQLWQIRGHHWKGVTNDAGEKLPEGSERHDPWTVVQPVARAIDVLERLHPHQLLFPAQLRRHGKPRGTARPTPRIKGCTDQYMANAIEELTGWVNHYCQQHGHETERIPADPHGRVALSRLRRTLAWHIVRRPRGLVAGAIQYGHLFLKVTRGYGGAYDSGFPDDHAYEEWLYRLDQIGDWEQRLAAGEHVSGPAADTYVHRVRTAHAQFAGRVLTRTRQALDLLDNPLLQIYPGQAMTCVFDPNKALCQLFAAEGDARRTPDQDDCRPACKNIAYTENNIAELQARARKLRALVSDRLAPSIRRARERQELERIETIIRSHPRGR